jgi:hypothetical protein
MVNSKDTAEAKTELITAALLVIVFALFLIGKLNDPLAMLAGGLILLGSGFYQSRKGWHVSLMTWVVGGLLALGGLGLRMFLVTRLEINYVAIGLLAVGAYLLWSWMQPRR